MTVFSPTNLITQLENGMEHLVQYQSEDSRAHEMVTPPLPLNCFDCGA